MVEVNLHDLVFMLVNDALSTGDLLGWVEDVTVAEANLGSYQARLTIVFGLSQVSRNHPKYLVRWSGFLVVADLQSSLSPEWY